MKWRSMCIVLLVVLLLADSACSAPANQPNAQPQTGTGIQQGRQGEDQPQVPNNPQVPDNPQVPNDNDDQPQAPAQFKLTGSWYSQTDTAYGTVYLQLILEPTDTFSQQARLSDLLTYDVGTYVVGDGYIHFTVTDHQPKVYRNQPMQWVNSFTYFIIPVDQNTMQVEDHVVGTQWTMYRQGP